MTRENHKIVDVWEIPITFFLKCKKTAGFLCHLVKLSHQQDYEIETRQI